MKYPDIADQKTIMFLAKPWTEEILCPPTSHLQSMLHAL
jgi:hypothetical protein